VYSFSEHQRLGETKYLYGAAIIIAEGILALHDPAMRALYDMKVNGKSSWSGFKFQMLMANRIDLRTV